MAAPIPKLSPEKLLLLHRRLKGAAGGAAGERVIQPRATKDPAALSFAQHQMWLIEQMSPGTAAYNLPVGYRLKGPLNRGALVSGFDAVISRHEILRTTFSSAGGKPVQVVQPPWKLQMAQTDLGHLPKTERESEVRRLAEVEALKPFDLTQLPLLKVSLFRLSYHEHVLFVNLHHILGDGISASILLNELDACYRGFVGGVAPALPALAAQYADYAEWEQREATAEDWLGQVEFWKEQLKGELPVLELPWDKPRPAVQSFAGSNVFFDFPASVCKRLRAVAVTQDCTFFMAIVAAYGSFLHRYSGATTIVIGTPVANRTMKEVRPLIGNFLNILALRCNVSGESSFHQMLRETRALVLDAFSHREVPFERLVELLRLPRDPSRNPVFQTMLQVLPRSDCRLGDLEVSDFHFDLGIAQFDLSLHFYEVADGYRGRLEYCSALLTRETAERLARHFLIFLENLAAQPEHPIAGIPFVSAAERQQLLVDWNATATNYPREASVHQLFEAQVIRAPTAAALVWGNKTLTYAELNARADALAGVLRVHGVGPDVRVCLCVERSFDLVVGVLGILKAGGAYVPIDPAYPPDRITFVLEDSQTPVLVTQRSLLTTLPTTTAFTVLLDERLPLSAIPAPAESVTATNLAYVLYTSGSTGKPKGVQIEHRAVVNFLESMRREPGLSTEDTVLAVTTLSFDIAGLELYLPLTTGARIVIASRDETLDGTRLAKLMKATGTTFMQATPATWRMLIDAGWAGNPRLKILCGGEAIDQALAEQLLLRCGELWNMYGPTETTIWSTIERLQSGQPITIGRPIANTQIYILDSSGQPTPPGVVGELLIGGDGVARGYLHRPELTAEKFIRDPFSQEENRRLYRTGDLARYRTDGRIDFLGRADFQVKIRGFRIEIGEIETALSAIEGVARAIVTVREDTPGSKRLVGYIVPRMPELSPAISANGNAPTRLNATALRSELRSALPEYMIPTAFVILETLPLTPNGKVDRKALPEPGKTAGMEARYEPPQGATEEKLAGIMGKLLQLPKVGRTDDFFALGGYSILAVSLFNEIESLFGKRIPLATLVRAPTVAALAAHLETETTAARKWDSLVPIQVIRGKTPFFCVHGAGGNILLYRDLVRALGPNYSFYGLQSQGLDRQTKPLRTVEEMAEHYLREIRAIQPDGPYFLGGYCLGGTIAYEMAQRLRAERQFVALLALFDTYNFTQASNFSARSILWQKISFHGRNLASLSLKDLSGYLSSKARVATDGELRSLWNKLSARAPRKKPDTEASPPEKTVQETNDAAAAAYRPKPYAGSVIVFKPKINYSFLSDPKMGWGDSVLGDLEIVALPINPHAMLVSPFVRHLANELRARIDRIDEAMQKAKQVVSPSAFEDALANGAPHQSL